MECLKLVGNRMPPLSIGLSISLSRRRMGMARTLAEIRNRTLEHLNGTPPPDDCSVLKVSLC